jgi:eukaryotic-like serine/threonine-protein kinase
VDRPPYGNPPPDEPWPPEAVTEVTEVYEGPTPPPPGRRPLWHNVWFWLALLGLVAVVIVLIAILATRDDATKVGRTVPDVVGLRQSAAVETLAEAGYRNVEARRTPSTEERGIVIDQDPDAGTRLRRNQTVQIVVSRGPEVVTTVETVTESVEVVAVPDVLGDDHVAAGATIDGIDLIADSFPVESGEPRGTVVAQDPAGGSEVSPGTHVRLAIALGSGERPTGAVPDVTGLNELEARATARESGFTVRTIERPAPTSEERGEVILQRPAPGTTVPILTQIRIFVGR